MLQHINVRVNHRCQNSPTSSVETPHRSWCIHFIPLMWLKGITSESGTCTYFNLDASFRGFFWQLEQVLERVSWRSHQTEQRSCNNCPKICTCDLISIISLHSKTGQEAPGWRHQWRMVTKSVLKECLNTACNWEQKTLSVLVVMLTGIFNSPQSDGWLESPHLPHGSSCTGLLETTMESHNWISPNCGQVLNWFCCAALKQYNKNSHSLWCQWLHGARHTWIWYTSPERQKWS